MAKSRLDRMPSNDLNEMKEIDLLELFRAVLKYGLTSNLVTLL